jgi:hypothetical protein
MEYGEGRVGHVNIEAYLQSDAADPVSPGSAVRYLKDKRSACGISVFTGVV